MFGMIIQRKICLQNDFIIDGNPFEQYSINHKSKVFTIDIYLPINYSYSKKPLNNFSGFSRLLIVSKLLAIG